MSEIEYEKEYLDRKPNVIKRIYYWFYRNTIVRIGDWKRAVKYGFQRARRGYADIDMWDMSNSLTLLIYKILVDYQKNHKGHPILLYTSPEEYSNLTEEQYQEEEDNWNLIIKEMIFHFQEATEETCQRTNPYELKGIPYFYKTSPTDRFYIMGTEYKSSEDKEESDRFLETAIELDEYRAEHKRQGYEMLSEYIDYLWD